MTKDSIADYRTKVKGYKNASSPVNRVCGRIPRIPPESATGGHHSDSVISLLSNQRVLFLLHFLLENGSTYYSTACVDLYLIMHSLITLI